MSTKFATIETTRGTITAELFARDCPATVENFERLANEGFYNGVRFHEVDGGRTAHTGDPLSRDLPPGDPRLGTGGPGYTIPCEVVGNRNKHERGALSMETAGPNTGGSRFFFVLDSAAGPPLDGAHTVFGMTEDGLDVLRAVEPNDVIVSVRVWE
jgi:peptidyl-prolyl cis-trans isomerase B (cyclophilin B)